MKAVQLIQRLHQHRAWVNRNLLAAASELTCDQLRQNIPIGQGSIWISLTHLYAAEYVWLAALKGDEQSVVPGDLPGKLPGNQLGEGGFTGLDDLKEKWHTLESQWADYLNSLTEQSLDDVIYKTSTSSGKGMRFGTRRSDVLLHVCTHAHYTIAQVMNMFRQCGLTKFPDVMLVSLARQESINSSQ